MSGLKVFMKYALIFFLVTQKVFKDLIAPLDIIFIVIVMF